MGKRKEIEKWPPQKYATRAPSNRVVISATEQESVQIA